MNKLENIIELYLQKLLDTTKKPITGQERCTGLTRAEYADKVSRTFNDISNHTGNVKTENE